MGNGRKTDLCVYTFYTTIYTFSADKMNVLFVFVVNRFSGITPADMWGVITTIRDVQAVLLSMFNEKTIVIGHSLESDFTAMKVVNMVSCKTNFQCKSDN
jgi:hypothetical protein